VDTTTEVSPETTLTIEQRGRAMTATVVKTPFVRAGQWATGN
jgi:hypothetical protein